MEGGLDQLIESLLTEIAFSGVHGCSVSALLRAIESFYRDAQDDIGSPVVKHRSDGNNQGDANGNIVHPSDKSQSQQGTGSYDIAVASKVWRWLVARPDVSVGINRQFNHLLLDEILALPEADPSPSTGGTREPQNIAISPDNNRRHHSKGSRESGKAAPSHRPRLHVSEERQWKTLAGHGPDLKRVPLYEWKALVDIASVREEGILQGDLVRLSGQDKRSLPTRTDALARKGYIIKQPVILRGCRSSKIWLAQFADSAEESRDGLNLREVDLSKETLTRDLRPVPFSGSWNGERIDYIAIAQAFNAVVKAWELIRYCDIRTKLDVEERVPQMRALAKTSRWFTSIGAVTFVAAKFADSHRLFKDCVKFVREPTAEEWKVFRSTPRACIKVPSARLGKRGQASRARYNKEINPSTRSQEKPKHLPDKEHEIQLLNQEPTASLWTPYKPIVNTAFEIIKRAGPEGSSNVTISRLTLGYAYRKYIVALTGAMSSPHSQPPHLKHLDVISQLNRLWKTMTYQFFAKSEISEDQKTQDREADTITEVPEAGTSQQYTISRAKSYTFSQPVQSKFAPLPSSSPTQLHNLFHGSRLETDRNRKRKTAPNDEAATNMGGGCLTRPRKIARIEEPSSTEMQGEKEPKNNRENDPQGNEAEVVSTMSPQKSTDTPELAASPRPPPRPPGVYREPNNFLDPPGKKGRRRKSVVITFRIDSLKYPSFLKDKPNRLPVGFDETSSHQDDLSLSVNQTETPSQAMATEESPLSVEAKMVQAEQTPGRRGGKVKSGGKTVYRCDKCGNSWKNSNGLEYHLKKSRTTCNSAYIPPPPPPPSLTPPPAPKLKALTQRKPPKIAMTKLSKNKGQDGTAPGPPRLPNSTRKPPQRIPDGGARPPLVSSKRVRLSETRIKPQDPKGPYKSRPIRGSLVLQDVEAYDVISHRRRREISQPISPSLYSMASHHPGTRQELSQETSQRPSRNRERDVAYKQGMDQGRDASNVIQARGINHGDPSIRKRETSDRKGPEAHGGHRRSHAEQEGELNGTLALSGFNLRPCTATAKFAGHGQGSAKTSANTGPQNQQSTSKRTHKSSTSTLGAIRRERTSQIVQHLIDKNDGVFPGQRSLYLAVVSLWVKEHSDMGPPDWKVLQNVVNRMDRARVLMQFHFFFIDESGKLQDCCVLAKNEPGETGTANLATDPKVTIVKEKMREMFPEPYIPEAFSPSQEESELFNALASKHRDTPQTEDVHKQPQKSNVTEDIEVLRYPAHIMGNISIGIAGSKHAIEDAEDMIARPAKKVRVESNKPQSTPKTRKRSEYWDTGNIAQYIWNQKQNTGKNWEQKLACLQDFTTGTWSGMPEKATSPGSDIDAFLSSLRRTRENALAPTWQRFNSQLETPSEALRSTYLGFPETLHRDDSYQDGDNEEHDNPIPNSTENPKGEWVDRFVEPSLSTSFVPEEVVSEEEEDDTVPIDVQHAGATGDNSSIRSDEVNIRFTRSKIIKSTKLGCWPWMPTGFFESIPASFTLVGAMPDARWFQRENLPQSTDDVMKTCRGKFRFEAWADPCYGKFLREVGTIERWEQSAEGSQILLHGSVAPDYIFLSLMPELPIVNAGFIALEWPSKNQYTAENIPEEVRNAPSSYESTGLSDLTTRRGREQDQNVQSRFKPRSKHSEAVRKATMKPQQLQGPQPDIQYKTRSLRPIPIQHRGRVSRPHLDEENLGLSSEAELIAAYVVFKTLLGGIERIPDLGSILKIFPKFSLSALRKFWPKINRERRTYIDALTSKFQSAFLQAYESGELPPLDYDDIDSYDWKSLIIWTTKLETHENVDLPESRRALDESYSLENPVNEVTDWREIWFSGASIYSRIEAVSGEPLSMPLRDSPRVDQGTMSLARSWVRSLCCTPIKGPNTPEQIRAKLLELACIDEAETNKLLKKVVDQLTSEKVAARSKGKILGQSLRLHGVFVKQLQKHSNVEKFAQAANFKASLDEAFHREGEFLLPYAADDGAIMATINLQAHARIRLEPVKVPHIPFGFEPGNYDGRTFPKSYYHFKVRLLPTERYIFNEDMPLLEQAPGMQVPQRGPLNEIPIWFDLFGNLDEDRWIAYLGIMAMALAIKGPLTPTSASVLLKPLIEEFEAKIIMDWIDSVGLIQRTDSERSATIGEWWWLVVGKIVEDVKRRTSCSVAEGGMLF
ncbi:hypothetical protein AAE478_004580 [Parahypoxylon ruwenzoriense]